MKRRFIFLAPASIACLAYINSFWGAFQFDDYNVIVNYAVVHSWPAWFHNLSNGIRPVLKLSYLINWTCGLGLFGFHLFNLAIHAANTVLVYFLSRRIFKGYSAELPAALCAALFFAIHPVQTESVSYICGRSTSLMAAFYFGSMLAYIRGSDDNRVFWSCVASPILFILGLFTKETALTLPLALLIWESGFGVERRFSAMLRKQSVHWVLFSVASFFLIAHPGYGRLLENCFDIRSLKETLLSQVNGIFYLLSKLIIPVNLNIDPDLPVLSRWSLSLALEAVLLFALLCIALIRFKKSPWIGFGILWFFLILLPTNSFIPRLDVANERQLYMSSWGLFLIVAIAFIRLQTIAGARLAYGIMAAILAVLFCLTVTRNNVYRNEITFWEDVVKKSPNKPRALNNLGYAYAIASRYGEAEKAYQQALKLDPDYEPARANLKTLPRNRR
jgi:protein O-mannosyl-transferase